MLCGRAGHRGIHSVGPKAGDGGASISLLFGTSAAGWASQVGYQNDLISRLDW